MKRVFTALHNGLRVARVYRRSAPTLVLGGLVLAIFMNLGVAHVPANADNCQVGSSSSCPATSPQEIYNLYGTTTDGTYWLRVGGVATQVYAKMSRTGSDNGGWVLLMKGTRGTTNFGYDSTYFTSNTTTLNTTSLSDDVGTDAKFSVYNNLTVSKVLAVLRNDANGLISNQGDIANNAFNGHVWLNTLSTPTTAYAHLANFSNLNTSAGTNYSNVPVSKYRQTSNASSTLVFSYQTGNALYGTSVGCSNGPSARLGIIWNNENDWSSCDTLVGIGLKNGATNLSPGDRMQWDGVRTGGTGSAPNGYGKGETAFQIWGKIAEPTLATPGAPTLTSTALDSVNVSWTASAGSPTDYVVQYKLSSETSWGTNPSQSVVVAGTSTTITGLSSSTSYDFRVTARTSTNSSSPSSVTTHAILPRTISFNSNSGSGTLASITVASGVSTNLPANTFTRFGYTFRGWNTLASGTGTNYTDGQSITTSVDLTLYAMWTSLDDRAWSKTDTQNGYYASATAEVIPVGQTAEWTVETWLKPGSYSANTWYGILGQASSSTNRYSIWVYNNNLHLTTPTAATYLGANGQTTAPVLSYVIKSDAWTHLAWVMSSGTSSKLYIDGVLVWQGDMARSSNAGSVFTVGGTEQADREFPGQIDQVKVWGAQLTEAQIQTSMHTWGTFAGAPTLRAHYDFNEFIQGSLLDKSGNNRHLNLPTSTTASEFTSSAIVETGNVYSTQTYVKFNRSYLTAAGGWTPPAGVSNVKGLVVAGGGGGGAWVGGGGGAGGVKQIISMELPSGAVPITVGQGGRGARWDSAKLRFAFEVPTAIGSATNGTNGQTSSISTTSATGGGKGGSWNLDSATYFGSVAGNGGSGGGGVGGSSRTDQTGGTGVTGQGFAGGNGSSAASYPNGGGGGAGGAGSPGTSSPLRSGNGGPGITTKLTGATGLDLAGGGGGGEHNSGATPGTATHGAGNGATATNVQAGSGQPNTGGGGGGSGGASSTYSSYGGDGGSGVVIISYGASMEVIQTTGGAKAGSVFQRPIKIQLKNTDGSNFTGADQQVTLSASSSTVLQQTVDGVTTNITSVTTTSQEGVATFSNIGFQSGVGSSAQTLTVTADAFLGTTLSVSPTFVASSVNITASGATNGTFIDGVFQSNTSGTANILNSDLVSALSASNAVVESTGSISISASVISGTNYALTLRAGTDILQGAVEVSTSGGAITYWSDTDTATARGGGIQTARGSTISTDGGNLTLSGGTDVTTGYSKGTVTSSYRGINLQGSITTGSGNVIMRGEDAATEKTGTNNNTAWGAGITFTDGSSLTTTSGTVTLTGLTNSDNVTQIHRHAGVMIGMHYFDGVLQDSYADASISTGSGAITISGTGTNSSYQYRDGVMFLQGSVTSTLGTIEITGKTARTDAYDINFGVSRTGNTISSGGAITITGDTNGALSNFVSSSIFAGGALTLNVNKPTFTSMTLNGAGAKIIQHPTAATNFGAAIDITGVSFANTTKSLTVGRSGVTPTQTVTLGNANTSIAGDVTVYGAAITQSGAVTTTGTGSDVVYSGAGAYSQSGALNSSGSITQSGATSVSVNGVTTAVGAISYSGSGDVSLNKDLTSTGSSSGILVKCSGAIITGAGTNSTTGAIKFTTTGGPITFWAGSDGSGRIDIAKWNYFDSNSAGTTGGGDITLGGGTTAAAGNANKPAGPVVAVTGSDAVQLGSDATTDSIQIYGDGGKVYIGGDNVGSATTDSGIEYFPGLKINAGEVELYGRSAIGGSVDNTASGIFSAQNSTSTTVPITITATNSYLTQTEAIKITSVTASNFGLMLGNFAPMTIQATGAYGAISINGSTADTGATGVWMGKTTIKTTSGYISIDSSNDRAELGKESARPLTVGDSNTTGSINIYSDNPVFTSASLATTGQVFVQPSNTSNSFSTSVTVPSATTSFSGNETGLFVGGENGNSASVTVGAAVSIAGPIYFWAGTLSVNNALNSASGDQHVDLSADQMTIAASVDAGATSGTGYVELTPLTSTKIIALGSIDSASQLGLTDTELDYIGANTLRIGDYAETNSGNISVTGTISIGTSKVAKTALRTTGAVSGSGTITATNLGIKATSINFGNAFAISGNLALAVASAPTFSSSTTYTPASVDGIAADFGVATQITLSQVPVLTPTDAFMAVAFNPPPIATLKDKFGTALQSQNSTATANIVASKATGSGTLAGTLTRAAAAGAATFSDLKITGTGGDHTITFTSGSLTATTGTYNVLAGEPASLVVSMLQTTISAGKTFNAGTIPTVTLKDVGGNTIASGTHATATVTATLIGTGGSITAGQTTSAESGVATFDTLALAGTVGQDYSLQFTVEFIDTAGQTVSVDSTETSITFTPGDAYILNLVTPAQGFTNRTQFTTQPSIEVLDEYSNRVTNYVGDIDVQINSGTLTGQTSVAVSEGIATFADLGKHDIIGIDANRTLTFSAGDLVSDSQTFVLTFGAAYQLELTRPAAGFVNNEMFEVQPQITVQDQDGNLVEDFAGEVNVTQSSGTLAGAIIVNAQAGIATFSGLVLTGSTATSYSLTFETDEPYLQVVQNEISLVAGVPHHLSIIQSPSSAFNRVVFATQPIIEIQDISNNPVPNSGLTVAVSSNAMTLMGTLEVLAESGQAEFSELYFQDLITISSETLTFTATGLEPVATNVTVTHGAASKLTVRPAEVSAISGEIFTSVPEVTIEDADGNTVTDSTLVVSVSVLPSAGGALPAGTFATGFDDQIFGPSGVLSFNQAIISGVAQEYTVTYSATGIQSTSQTVHLTHSAAAKLVKIAMPAGARAGIQFGTNPKFEIRDAYDNIVDTGVFATSVVTATVAHNEGNRENTNLGSVASNNEPVTAIAVGGVVEFTDIYLTGDAGDTYEITFSVSTPSNDISANTQDLILSAGNPYKLSIITQPENLVAGENFISAPQVQIVDEWNNPVEGVSESFAIQANLVNLDGVLLDNSQTAVTVSGANDTATFDDISFSQMGSHKLTFSSQPQLISVTSQQFEIQSAAADHLAFVTEGSKTVRNGYILSDAPVLQILDAFDNPVSAGPATTVVVSVVGENRADVAGIEGSQISTVSGSNELSFDDLAIHAKSGSYTLRFTALNEGLPIDGAILDFTETIEVTFGDAAGLVISQPANGARAGLEFDAQPRVQVVDANENLVADSDLQIEAGLTDANYELIGSGPARALMGEAQFSDLGIAGEAATNITLVYSAILSNGTAVQVSQSIDLEAGDVSNLVTEVGASTVQTGSVMDPAPSVTLRDTWGNTVLSDSSTRLQLQLYDASDNPVVGQTATASADQGTVTFTDLIVSAPAADGYYFVYTVLDNSDLPLDIQTSTNTFEITPGAPTEIEIVTAPHTWNGTSRTKSGDELKIQPLVQILDADGNLATQVDGQIANIAVIGDGGVIRGSTTAVISGGQAQFAGVKLSGKSARAANDAVPAQSAVHYTFAFTFEHDGTVISTSTTDNPDNPVIVDHNKAHHLTIVRDAGVAKAGKILVGSAAPIVEIRDADDNLVNTSGTGSEEGLSISATVKKTGTSSTLQVFNNGISANQGVAVMNIGFGGLATDSYTYTFSVQSRANSSLANYIQPDSQSGVQITYGTANTLVQRTAVDSISETGLTMTGEALAVQPVFELQDGYGNIDQDAGAENGVQASLVGGSNDNEYLENVEAFANAGFVTFSDLTLVGIPNQPYLLAFSWMNVEDQVITTPENSPITVTHNYAAQLRIATQPASGSDSDRTKTGDRLATQPVIEVLDRYGNLVTNDDAYSSVRIIANLDNPQISDPPSRLIDLNDADATEISASISGGRATFTSLGVVAIPEELQYLRFSATGLTGTTETLITEQSQPFTVTYAKAAKLAMVTQPCTGMLSILTETFCISGASGEILGVQPAVEVLDRFNNRVLNYSGEVTVSLLKDEADQASLSVAEGESLSISFENGIATFSGISLTGTPRTNYRLNFTSSDPDNSDAVLTSATSDPIEVLHAAPSQIVIVTQPVGAKTGDLLAVQPRIEIRDEFGNLADTDSTTEIRVVASGGNLEGTTTIQVEEGIAQFSDLTFIGSPVSTYTLTFTSEQITGAFAESEDFHVTHGDVVSIEWVIKPSAGKTGDRISAELVMLDFDGNVATTVTPDEITADVFSGGGQLENATGLVTEGFITFDNLILIASPGVPQQITVAATISGVETRSPPSTAVSLTHADPAYIAIDTNICAGDITINGCQLGQSGTLMVSQPVLNVFDRFGNPTDTDNSTQVTVSINAENSGDANGVLGGNTTITVANGVAEFTNLTFAGSPGVGYTFSFAASFAGQSISGVNDETVSTVSVQTEFEVFEYESVAYSVGGMADPIITTNVTEGTNIEFSYRTDSSESICVVDSTTGRVSIHGAGICVVKVVASALPYFRPSSEISAEFVISKAVQAPLVVITSTDQVDYKQNTLLTPTYEGGSGTGAVELYTLGECRLIDGKLFTYNAGSCTIRAIKAEDANYLERVSPAKVITINKVPQEDLHIGNTNTTSVGDLTLFVTGGSGNGAVTYSVHPDDAAHCSILSGNKLHRSTSGTCQVSAYKSASANFTEASAPLKTIRFAKKAQTVTFSPTNPVPAYPAIGTSYVPLATASSGNAVTFSLSGYTDANNPQGTTAETCIFDPLDATKVKFTAAGFCEITATQSGTDEFEQASTKRIIAINLLNQSVDFASIPDTKYGSPAFVVKASSSSGLVVNLAIGSATTTDSCGISGVTSAKNSSGAMITSALVKVNYSGICEIVATQPGNGTYAKASPVSRVFQIAPDQAGPPKISSISISNQAFTATFTPPSYLGGSALNVDTPFFLEITRTDTGDVYGGSNCALNNGTYTCVVPGLPNEKQYTATVSAITAAGAGLPSAVAGPITATKNPMGVTNLTLEQPSETSLQVNWEDPSVLDGALQNYAVYVAPLGSTDYQFISTTTSTNYDVTLATSPLAAVRSGLSSGGGVRYASAAAFLPVRNSLPTYSANGYQVKVITVTSTFDALSEEDKNAFEAEYSSVGKQIIDGIPSEPRSLSATRESGKIYVSWAAPLYDGGAAISQYTLTVTGPTGTLCTQADSLETSCTISAADPYSNYSFAVVAVNANQKSSAASTFALTDAIAKPTPKPEPKPTTEPTSEPTPAPTKEPTSEPTKQPTPQPTAAPTSEPTAAPTPEPSEAPSPEPTFEAPVDVPPPIEPAPGVSVAPQPTEVTNPIEALSPTIELPTINPGEPVANPAIGATGDDSAPPQEFSPLSSPEGVAAATETATKAVTMVSAVAAAAAAAAAGAAAAAAAAGASAAAGAASSASAASSAGSAAGGAASGGGSTGGGNSSGSSSSSSSDAGRRPDDFAAGEESQDSEGGDDPESIDVTQDNITIERESWGDKLAMFTLPFITFFDRRSHNAAERIAKFSPFAAKLINDGAYLRAMLGTISTALPIAASIIALAAVADNAAEIAAGDYSKMITPAWFFLLAIAMLGAFDAAAGFTGAMVFIIGSVITVGHIPDSGEIRTMMGIMLVSVGPALLTTGFRTIRKHAALNFNAWWERIADFVIAPFMAGWSVSAMVSGLPALAGLTLDVANHVNDFVFYIAIAIFIRVALEELAAAGFPARLNRINPDEIPDPSILQRSIVLVIKYGVWVFIGGALIGPSWQVWVGSALFVFPTVIGWFTDKFPNSPRIWRILPTGIPGLAFTLFVASATSATVGAILGTTPDLGKWSFLILPIPMLAITVLGWFGRHGAIDADGNEEERPGKRNQWIYRIGGVVVMVLTLKLAGVI